MKRYNEACNFTADRAFSFENNTLTTLTPNHIDFIDNNYNIIHLKRISPPPSPSPSTSTSQSSIAKTTTEHVAKTVTEKAWNQGYASVKRN